MASYTSAAAVQSQNAPLKKEIWSSLLNSVSSGKRLAEKQLVVLGGTPESQREFIASLETDTSPAPSSRNQSSQKPPIANEFALGYTYQDVLDTDHEDILARLSIYTLAKPSPRFIPLLRPIFTPKTVPHMLLVILLDWSDPWNWIRQLRSWTILLDSLLQSLPQETTEALKDNIEEWRDNKRNHARDSTVGGEGVSKELDADVALPLGPGEWDMPLGVPLCVVCQNSNKTEILDKESGWRDPQFDFVQQFLRTILLKHGGSLIYTMPHLAGTGSGSPLQTLIHSIMGIESMLQKSTLRHNITERDHILVPPNFDSWGKIRILTPDFDAESVSNAWAEDISAGLPSEDEAQATSGASESDNNNNSKGQPLTGAVAMYEEYIQNPHKGDLLHGVQAQKTESGIEVDSKDVQAFLSEQGEKLEGLAKEDERQLSRESTKKPAPATANAAGDVQEHIGTVQFNVGGIQMDVDQALRQLNNRETPRTEPEAPTTPPAVAEDDKVLNEKYRSFFAGLTKKAGGSATNSPRRGADGH